MLKAVSVPSKGEKNIEVTHSIKNVKGRKAFNFNE